jgi:hypothetical protein
MFTSDGSDSAAVAQIVDLYGQLAITLTVAGSIIATSYDKNPEMLIEQIRQCKYTFRRVCPTGTQQRTRHLAL